MLILKANIFSILIFNYKTKNYKSKTIKRATYFLFRLLNNFFFLILLIDLQNIFITTKFLLIQNLFSFSRPKST